MNKLAAFATVLAAAALAVSPAQAKKYKVVTVTDGGTITGKVTVDPAKVETESILIAKDPAVCGTGERKIHWVRANGDALLDAVVYLAKVPAGKAFPPATEKLTIDQKGCTFIPFLGTMANRGELVAINSDPVTHNIHTYEMIGRARRTVLNVSQPKQGSRITKKIKLRRGVAMKVECDVHNFMHGFVFVAKNPYFAVVGDDGSFTIGDVPPGKYVIKAWHGRLGETKAKVEVKPGGTAKVDFAF